MNTSIESKKSLTDEIVSKAIARPTNEEMAREERLKVLSECRITTVTEVVDEQYSLTVDGVGIFALSDIHALKGKQKSGKSAVLKVCAAALMCGQQFRVKSELEAPRVLFIDTEQQAADVRLILDEVKLMSGRDDDYINDHLLVYTLRRMSYDTLLSDTQLLISEMKPQVVFIDGVVDYVASFNDEVLSRELIHHLLVLCEEHQCAIVNVLHENKAADDFNMRGHLGTVLSQKGGTVLRCQKAASGTINVTCPDARHGTMPTWSISFNGEGHIEDADQKRQESLVEARKKRQADKQAKQQMVYQQRLDAALSAVRSNGGYIERSRLTSQLTATLRLSRPTVSKLVTQMVKNGHLFEAEKYITATAETIIPF